jgi:hypothetical protein
VSGSRCFATENVEVFRLFHTSLPPTRKRAKYVPDGLYRTRFSIAVLCQTFRLTCSCLPSHLSSVVRTSALSAPGVERTCRCGNPKTVRTTAGALRANPK